MVEMKCKCENYVEHPKGKFLGILKDNSCWIKEKYTKEEVKNCLSFHKFKCKFCGKIKTAGIQIGGELPQ